MASASHKPSVFDELNPLFYVYHPNVEVVTGMRLQLATSVFIYTENTKKAKIQMYSDVHHSVFQTYYIRPFS